MHTQKVNQGLQTVKQILSDPKILAIHKVDKQVNKYRVRLELKFTLAEIDTLTREFQSHFHLKQLKVFPVKWRSRWFENKEGTAIVFELD
jgi:hypothetical protein